MAELVKIRSDAHWYRRNPDGTAEPCHEVPKKDGKGMTPTTLRQARTMNLLPSVTTVLQVIPKDALVAWKVEQGILAALTLPRMEHEPLESFAHRIAMDAEETAKRAADFGTRVHRAIDDWLTTGEGVPESSDIHDAVASYQEWHTANVEEVYYLEQPFAVGSYGGQIDMICKLTDGPVAVVDFKTQGAKPGKSMVAWDTYPIQLRAYTDAAIQLYPDLIGLNIAKQLNVMISSTPGDSRVEVIEHTAHDYHRKLWVACLQLWMLLKEYYPGTETNNG